ncbi:MAG TPA: phosphatase PAP2 family protein [Thermomonospora sp.]|nr:phosphatase PAP2 family protein [Thermomonospora sp.]
MAARVGVRLPRREWAPTVVLLVALGGLFALYGPLNRGPARWSARTPLDERIPLVEEMVVPYVSALALGPLTLVLFLVTAPRLARSALVAGVVLLLVAYLFYVFAQTRMERPPVTGDDVFSATLRLVYGTDGAYNCFPSLHTGFSLIMAVHWVRYHRRVGVWVAGWCVLIMVSTLLVRQHYLADLVAGLVVAGLACGVGARVTGQGVRSASTS